MSFIISASHERVSRVVEGTSKLISGDCGFQKILQGNRPLSAIHAVVLMFTDKHVDQQVTKTERERKITHTTTLQTIPCSMPTVEALGKGVKYIHS